MPSHPDLAATAIEDDLVADCLEVWAKEWNTTVVVDRLNNFSIRVRHTLDDHLGDLIYALRKQGVKTSKTEIFELLLWELPVSADADLRRRIEQFRQRAPRV